MGGFIGGKKTRPETVRGELSIFSLFLATRPQLFFLKVKNVSKPVGGSIHDIHSKV